MKPETRNKLKKLYDGLHPALWMVVGAGIIYYSFYDDYSLSDIFQQEPNYKVDGKFACWYFEDIDYSKLDPLETDVIQAFHKHCVDIPKP